MGAAVLRPVLRPVLLPFWWSGFGSLDACLEKASLALVLRLGLGLISFPARLPGAVPSPYTAADPWSRPSELRCSPSGCRG